jgi:hypothetical protein
VNIVKIACAAALLASTVACSTFNQSAPSQGLQSQINADFAADIEVGSVTKGRSRTIVLLGFITLGDSKYADGVNYGVSKPSFGFGATEDAKSAAAYNALKKTNADILVAPRYTVDEFNFLGIYRTIDAEVVGFSANIKSVKQK